MNKIDSFSVEQLLQVDNEDSRTFNLVLPDFQRQFVWKLDAQRELLCSLLAGIPIGSLLIQRGKWGDFVHRPLCYTFYAKDNVAKEKEEQNVAYLLDGQQRLSTIKGIVSDIFDIEHIKKSLSLKYEIKIEKQEDLFKNMTSALRNRWYLTFKGIEKPTSHEREKLLDGLFDAENKENDYEPDDYENFIEHDDKVYKNSRSLKNHNENIEDLIDDCKKTKRVPMWLLLNDKKIFKQCLRATINATFSSPIEGETSHETVEKNTDLSNQIVNFLEARILKVYIPCQIIEHNKISYGIVLFEQVNTTGQLLTVYDLIVSKYGRNEHRKSLNDLILKRLRSSQKRKTHQFDYKPSGSDYTIEHDDNFYALWDSKNNLPTKTFQKLFVNCLALEKFRGRGGSVDDLTTDIIKKKQILDRKSGIKANDIEENWEKVVDGLKQIFELLHIECGLYKLGNIPYELMIVPLYWCLFSNDDSRQLINDRTALNKCKYWYWISIFAGRYQQKQNSIAIKDCGYLSQFLNNKNKFRDIFTDIFPDAKIDKEKGELERVLNIPDYSDSNVLCTWDSYKHRHNASLNKACMQFLLSTRPKSWPLKSEKGSAKEISTVEAGLNKNVFEEHHIIPKQWFKKGRTTADDLINSPMNLTCLTKKENIDISNAPYGTLLKQYNNRVIDYHGHFLHEKEFRSIIGELEELNIKEGIEKFVKMRFRAFKDALKRELKTFYKE